MVNTPSLSNNDRWILLLKKFPKSNLAFQVFEGLKDATIYNIWGIKKTKKQYLYDMWYLHTINELQLESYINDMFEAYYEFEENWEYLKANLTNEARYAYEEVTKLLIISWVARLITAWDWSVNRLEMAEKRHWLQENGFEKIEQVLAEKYHDYSLWENPLHLHKGPWNGVLVKHLLRRKSRNSKLLEWEETWVWDRLYFAIEEILGKFIKNEYKNNKSVMLLVEVLSTILKSLLKEKWFEQDSATLNKWKLKVPFCDLNDIYIELEKVLSDPNTYFERAFYKNWKIKSSKDFENDSTKDISLEQQGLIWKMLGKNWVDLEKILHRKWHTYYKNKLDILNKKKYWLELIKKWINKSTNWLKNGFNDNVNRWIIIRKLSNLLDIEINTDITDNDLYNKVLDWLKDTYWDIRKTKEILEQFKISKKDWSIVDLKKVINNFWKSIGLYDDIDTRDLFAKFFQNVFVSNVIDWNKPIKDRLDLNTQSEMYLENFQQWYFTDIPKLIKHKPLLITATRSDSHETDEQFEQDIANNIDLLQPGWCLLTDWVKESFSRINRYDVIKRILDKKNNEFKADVIVNSNNNEPLSILIQRKHKEKWYLTDEDKNKIFWNNIIFETVNDVASRPYIHVINNIRRKILSLTNDWKNIDIFNKLQWNVKNSIEIILTEFWINKLKKQLWIDYIEERFNEIWEIFKNNNVLFDLVKTNIKNIERNDFWFLNSVKSDKNSDIIDKLKIALIFPEIVDSIKYNQNSLDILKILEERFPECNGDIKWHIRQMIRMNWETRLLDKEDLKKIEELLELSLENEVQNHVLATRDKIKGTLDVIRPDEINVFTRLDVPISSVNRRWNKIKISDLPDNNEFTTSNFVSYINSKKKNLLSKLETLKRSLWIKPICIISYTDCLINEKLIEKIKIILWEELFEKYVNIVPIDYSTSEWEDLIIQLAKTKKVLNDYKKRWWIIIGSWGHTDSYDKYWEYYKDNIGEDLLSAVEEENSKLRVFNINLSYQIWADMIWKKHNNWKIYTKPWMLEVWPTPILIWKHEIFDKFPDNFTVSMFHSWHFYDRRVWRGNISSKHEKRTSNREWQLRYIAQDNLTWLPVAYSSWNFNWFDRIIGFQWQPEIDLEDTNSIHLIIDQFWVDSLFLLDKFWVNKEIIYDNYLKSRKIEWVIKANSWESTIISTLEYLARSIS